MSPLTQKFWSKIIILIIIGNLFDLSLWNHHNTVCPELTIIQCSDALRRKNKKRSISGKSDSKAVKRREKSSILVMNNLTKDARKKLSKIKLFGVPTRRRN